MYAIHARMRVFYRPRVFTFRFIFILRRDVARGSRVYTSSALSTAVPLLRRHGEEEGFRFSIFLKRHNIYIYVCVCIRISHERPSFSRLILTYKYVYTIYVLFYYYYYSFFFCERTFCGRLVIRKIEFITDPRPCILYTYLQIYLYIYI